MDKHSSPFDDLATLITEIIKVRSYQKNYFRTRSKDDLVLSKQGEKDLDRQLEFLTHKWSLDEVYNINF